MQSNLRSNFIIEISDVENVELYLSSIFITSPVILIENTSITKGIRKSYF